MAYQSASEFDSVESEDGESTESDRNANEIPFSESFIASELGSKAPIVEAARIYLLLPKQVPVSRAARFKWFLDHLNKVIIFSVENVVNFNADDIEIITIVPSESESKTPSNEYLITTSTEVIFLAQTYRFVYCLDMSPSQSAVDVEKDQVLFDEIINCFRTSLLGLCRQFTIPCCTQKFQPNLYLTVIVNTPFFISPAQQVIIKGVQISSHNVQDIINLVQAQFHHLEGRIAEVSARAYMEIDQRMLENEVMVGGLFDLAETECIANIPMVSPDSNFVNMLRYSMLATSLLPENSLSHILVVTDGVVAMPHSNILESLLYQLHYEDIAVSFLKVGSAFKPHTSAGYVPYTDLLEFLSDSTTGTLLDTFPVIKPEPTLAMNVYQQLYLLWSFQSNFKSKMCPKKVSNECYYNMIHRVPTLLVKRQNEQKLNSSISLLISRRMREGYVVKDVKYVNKVITVKLSLRWKTHIYIFYELMSPWPLTKNVTQVEINICAPYDFLHDITCMMKKETKSTFRQAVFERFWMRLTQLSSNDIVLAQQLSSFNYTNVWTLLPESVRNGIPVFTTNGTMTPFDGTAGTAAAIVPNDSSSSKFTQMWQPLCYLETNSWRKWFHIHKVSLILKHDHPLTKYIHLTNPSGRFQVIQCRQAQTALYRLLNDWSSFIVIDNHTYVKLLRGDEDKQPSSFCVIRLSSKLPCATINLGFMTGTPGYTRHQTTEDLKTLLRSLSYQAGPLKSKENICCTLLLKPLEKILIRYERIPTDFHTVIFPDGTQNSQESLPPSPLAGTLFTTLSRYLFHQRWIWNAMHLWHLKLDVHSISRILSTLTKMRIKEGFNFAHSASGIITMVLELAMDSNSSCVIQYVIFPPHSVWWGDNNNSGSDDDSEIKGYSELQIVTEVWIEPQFGKVLPDYPKIPYMVGKHYYELADMMKLTDMQCIHSLLTIEHLSLISQEKHPDSMNSRASTKSSKTFRRLDDSPIHSSIPMMNSEIDTPHWNPTLVERIQHIPFLFDPINILPLCQQFELLFSMFVEGKQRDVFPEFSTASKSNTLLLTNIHTHLIWINDHELRLTEEESAEYTKQVLQRHRYANSTLCPLKDQSQNSGGKPLWRCFVKGVSMTHVILTMIPATLEDIVDLTMDAAANPDDCSTEVLEENFRTSSQNSNYSEVPINSKRRMILPIYIYDCPLGVLVDSFVKAQNTKKPDVYEDHRYKQGQYFEPESIILKAGDESSTSPEPKSEDSEVSEQRNTAKQHCRAIALTHSKCFTLSLFSTLQNHGFIDKSDVFAALDGCEETLFEIDITGYLKTICGHAKFSTGDLLDASSLNHPDRCCELRQLHNLIKEKFASITRSAFASTSTESEYYYCRNFFENFSNKMEDSDDEMPASLGHKLETHLSQSCLNDSMEIKESEELDKAIAPLFLRYVCSVHYNNRVDNISIRLLPTCLGELLSNNDFGPQICLDKIQINLGILCLTLPVEVQNVINDYSTKELRHTSFCSDGFPPSCSSASEASFNSDFKDPEPLYYLPEVQKLAITSLRNEIEWLLQDEIAAALLDVQPVTTSTLHFVMNHVVESNERRSCILQRIDLKFVDNATDSFDRFIREFSTLSIPSYVLKKEDTVYYLAKADIEMVDEEINEDNDKELNYLDEYWKTEEERKFDERSPSDISSMNGSIGDTDGGYDEDVSENVEDYNWLLELNSKRSKLPNFWLIAQVEESVVSVYFHCRFLELPTTHVAIYLELHRAVLEEIRNLCKRVNQAVLLQSLHDTRKCNPLLEPEDNMNSTKTATAFNRLKSMEEFNDESENVLPLHTELTSGFVPGYFSCPVVWNIQFTLHPRLKTGTGKTSGISNGISALIPILDKFSVSNRSNLFVYKDCNENVFYLRLQENMQQSHIRGFPNKNSEFEQHPVTRSPSIASLPIGPQKNQLTRSDFSISSTTSSEIRPRVRSFGEKETKDGYIEDTVTLQVYGIAEVGDDIRSELYQVLQNRLDDAVLDVISVLLSRNAMCPFTPEDVHFLQKPFKPAEHTIKLLIQKQSSKMLDSFILYLKQNLLQFLNLPKYTDRSHSRFQDYTESEQPNKVTDDNIFIYNQSQNPSSGSRGIACIALAIIDSAGSVTSETLSIDLVDLIHKDAYKELVESNLLDPDDSTITSPYLEFRIWKQGRINYEMLHEKLCAATSNATWDVITEYSLLKNALCTEEATFGANNSLSANSRKLPHKEIKFRLNLDPQLTKGDINEVMNKHKLIYENLTNRRRAKRMIPPNSTVQRAILFDTEQQYVPNKSVTISPLESGDEGFLTSHYENDTISKWFEFASEINAPSLRKISLVMHHAHPVYSTIRELQHIISGIGNDTVKMFEYVPRSNSYVPYSPKHTVQSAIIVARNFEQWKTNLQLNDSIEFAENFPPKHLKNLQKFLPEFANDKYISRQKFLWTLVQSKTVHLYTYNWSKDNVLKLREKCKNLEYWMNIRASTLLSFCSQKLGLFHNQAIDRKPLFHTNNPYFHCIGDVEAMIKIPKERAKKTNSPDLIFLEIFRDTFRVIKDENVDPMVGLTMEMHEIRKVDKKQREELKKLYAMYQSRSNSSTAYQIQILMQNCRLTHYCHTPLLFLSRWRLQSAATRDHTIMNPSHYGLNDTSLEQWHEILLQGFCTEYKKYLQSLGFMCLEVDSASSKKQSPTKKHSLNVSYMQKAILGGILFFALELSEPFFITKLYSIECNRIPSSASKGSINQFTQSFLDECDKIKVYMHLHSFTYDFHLRSIYNYISNNVGYKVCHDYHLIHFLDDFMKYYNKAPNYARNLVHSGSIQINNLLTEGSQLYTYLLSNVKQYNLNVVAMVDEVTNSTEYVLVQVSSISGVSYKDSQDRQHTDDFDITIIISNILPSENKDYSLHLKYYLILTSRREIYPKTEMERKLGKFRTVSLTSRNCNCDDNCKEKEEDFDVEMERSQEKTSDSDRSLILPMYQSTDDESTEENRTKTTRKRSYVKIKQESVNYLGYYSSHEQLMQQLILHCADNTQKTLRDMVTRGMVHCRTHLLWNKLLSQNELSQLSFTEFIELKQLAKLENLSELNSNLASLMNQPFSWYQGLVKILLNKYNGQYRAYESEDGNIHYYVILHPRYVGAFMMLSIDMHISRGELHAVYRTSHVYEESEVCIDDRKTLLDGFINCICYYLWSGMI